MSLQPHSRRPEWLLVGVLLALAGTILHQAGTLGGDAGYSGISTAAFPYAVGSGLMLCAFLLGYEIHTGGLRSGTAQVQAPLQPGKAQSFLWVAGGLVLQMALIGRIGFVLASTLLLICVARGFGSDRVGRDFLIGLALTLPVQQIFSRLLGLNLPLLPGLS